MAHVATWVGAGSGERQLIEDTLGAIGFDQPLDRQQGGGQRGDPQRPAADPRQQSGVGADRERDDRRDQQEEGHRQPGGSAKSAADLARDERGDHRSRSIR